MRNFYEVAEIVEAGTAHELIQAPTVGGPGKNHLVVLECRTCLDPAYSMGTF